MQVSSYDISYFKLFKFSMFIPRSDVWYLICLFATGASIKKKNVVLVKFVHFLKFFILKCVTGVLRKKHIN